MVSGLAIRSDAAGARQADRNGNIWSMPGKRQHYVPRFLLRRFAIDPRGKGSLIYRLDTKSGQPKRVSLVNEAVVGHYYRITLEDGTVDSTADELLDRLETMGAEVVQALADPSYLVTAEDVYRLMLFIVALKQRTPQAREALREFDEQTSEMFLEMAVSDRAHYHRVTTRPGQTEEDVEAERLKLLDDIRSGKVFVESTPAVRSRSCSWASASRPWKRS